MAPLQHGSASESWPNWAIAWYTFLCVLAAVNLGLTLYLLCGRPSHQNSHPRWYLRALRALGFIYVLVVAYRSVFPADYPHRYVFWDNMMSSILIHRACAACEELAWVLQIVLVQSFCAAQERRSRAGIRCFRLVLAASSCMVLIIVAAECFSFAGTITQAFCWFTLEEACWGIAFAMGFPVYLFLLYAACKQRSSTSGKQETEEASCLSARDFALIMVIFCAGYVPYMFLVDVPSYWNDYVAQRESGFVPNTFADGFWNALTVRQETRDLSQWQSSLVWKTVYFACGPWLSMALMTAPGLAPGAKKALEEEVGCESNTSSEV